MTFIDEYKTTIRPNLKTKLHKTNIHSVCGITKIVVNVGVGEANTNKKAIEKTEEDLLIITGQKPIICKARKSVSAFKIRRGLPIGVKVTLRGKRAYYFLEKIIKIILPRIRDFKGISSTCFDKNGNLSIGLSDQTLFPEINYDTIDKIRGLEITFVTSTSQKEDSIAFFKELGMPII